MPRKKKQAKEFYVEGQEVKDKTAPVVGGEFIIPDAKEGELAQGQTVTVDSGVTLEDDLGTGEAIILRTFEFGANPQTFRDHFQKYGEYPPLQSIFTSHIKGITNLLWTDGLSPAEEIIPQVIVSKKMDKYFIIVGARPRLGQAVLEKPKTLSEIIKPKKVKA